MMGFDFLMGRMSIGVVGCHRMADGEGAGIPSAPFSLSAASALGFNLRASETVEVTVDWGDGTSSTQNVGSGADVTFSRTYDSAFTGEFQIQCAAGLDKITRLTTFTGTGAAQVFTLAQVGQLIGLSIFSNVLTGNRVSGDLAAAPIGLAQFVVRGDNTISGDLGDVPTPVGILDIRGANTISDYGGTFWKATGNVSNIQVQSASGGLSQAEVDDLIIDVNAQSPRPNNGTLNLSGGHAARSAASDAAVTALQGAGWTVTTS